MCMLLLGGESAFGAPFKDEFHSRLRFVRRGLVAMANAGKDDNTSQFFFTMAPTPELANKHTIFGKVVGDTVYNMLKLQEGVVTDERPDYPNTIHRAKVLNNPFDDIQPRKVIEMLKDEKRDKKPKSKMKATKDFKLLSFGEEAEEDEEDIEEETKKLSAKAKSSHDLLRDPKLSSEVGIEVDPAGSESSDDESLMPPPAKRATAEDRAAGIQSIKDKLRSRTDEKKKGSKSSRSKQAESEPKSVYEEEEEEEEVSAQERRRKEIRKEIKALKREMKQRASDGRREEASSEDDHLKDKLVALTEEEKKNDMLLAFHKEKDKYAEKSKTALKKGSAREEMTLKLLAKFKSKLHSVKDDEDKEEKRSANKTDDDNVDDDDDDVEGDSWMKHSLHFEKNDPVLAKDANTKDDDWFDIYDPRNPMNKRRRERDARSKGKR